MECSKCGFTNPQQARFCAGCGSGLAAPECRHCNTENSPGSRFCNNCGESLSDKIPPKALQTSQSERRILTALFCDLVDSTVLVDNLDPELCRAIIRDFQTISKQIIENNGGRVSTYLGDGIVALFTGHESNAERAINTALQLIRKIEETKGNFSRSTQKIMIRCGISTGLAVVGDDILGYSQVRQETAVGLPMNLAARLQSLALPGGVVIGDATHKITSGLFEFEDIGRHSLKGIKEAQQAWRVIAEKSISSRFVAHAAKLTPMVDRTETLQQLVGSWKNSKTGHPQAVIFTGEAGVGKSRIVQELAEIISIDDQYHYLEHQCSPYHTNTALYPVISRIKAAAGFEHGDPPRDLLSKLETLVRYSSNDFEHDMPAFVNLLSLPHEGKWPAPELDQDKKKEWLLNTLIDNIFSLSETMPLLVLVEDSHWIDPTTLELLTRMVDAFDECAILLLVTSRPGFKPAFLNKPNVKALEVERLPEKYSKQLVERIKGERNLPGRVLDEIVLRTEGIPLFIEELSKSMIESAPPTDVIAQATISTGLALPESLQDSLLARLDHLPDASKSIAHIAAVIGRDFSFDLLEKVAGYQDRNLFRALTPLLKAQLVLQRKAPPNAEFSFKHALLRDVAYDTLIKSDRAAFHKRTAEVIEAHYPDILTNSPELLARHYTEGEDHKKAVQYWMAAGKKASRQFALIEAREHLSKGLEILESGVARDAQYKTTRLDLLIALGPVLMALEGSGADITRAHYSDAVELCEQLPESAMQFKALWGQWLVSKDYQDDHGMVWANKLEQLSQSLRDSGLQLQAHHCQWTTHFHLGEFANANKFIVKGLKLYNFKHHSDHAGIYGGHDPKVCGDGFLAHVLWFRGDDSQALSQAAECYRWANKIQHKGSLLHAIELNMLLQLYRRDQAGISEWYDRLYEICTELGLPEYDGMLKLCKGLVKTYSGELETGIGEMKAGYEQLSSVGTNEDLPLYGEIIASTFLDAGKFEEGLGYIDDIIIILNSQRVQYWKAEVFRCKGELLMQLNENSRALQYFELALETAEIQRARILKLRAAISLFLCDQKTGLFPAGKQTLQQIYDDFASGTRSPEQARAQSLLSQSD